MWEGEHVSAVGHRRQVSLRPVVGGGLESVVLTYLGPGGRKLPLEAEVQGFGLPPVRLQLVLGLTSFYRSGTSA